MNTDEIKIVTHVGLGVSAFGNGGNTLFIERLKQKAVVGSGCDHLVDHTAPKVQVVFHTVFSVDQMIGELEEIKERILSREEGEQEVATEN